MFMNLPEIVDICVTKCIWQVTLAFYKIREGECSDASQNLRFVFLDLLAFNVAWSILGVLYRLQGLYERRQNEN